MKSRVDCVISRPNQSKSSIEELSEDFKIPKEIVASLIFDYQTFAKIEIAAEDIYEIRWSEE